MKTAIITIFKLGFSLSTIRSFTTVASCLLGSVMFSLLLVSHPLAATELPAPRVVSINLCADQLVLELAAAEQIVSLTNLSHNPSASVHFKAARNYPTNKGTVEEVIRLAPDLVIAGQFTNPHTLNLLRNVGLRVEILPIANSIDALFANLSQVSLWLEQPLKGEAIIATLKERLNALPKSIDSRPRAAVYDPNGYTVGKSSLRGEILDKAGWHNVASDKGIESYGSLSLETMVTLRPDVLISSPYSAGTWSRAQAMNEHPVLHITGVGAEIINVPSSHTICGGPWTLDVIEELHQVRKNYTEPVKNSAD